MTLSKGSVIILLSIATIMLVVTMFKKNDDPLTIISVNQVHTYLYTSDLETIPIPLLINKDDTHLLLEEAIDRVYITNEEATDKLPVTLKTIHKTHTRLYNEHPYHQMDLLISPALKTETLTTFIHNAFLVITYHDYPELRIPIGSFSYSFYDYETSHLSIETRINIPKHINHYPTSMGLYFNVKNKTDKALTITNISLLTDAVTTNSADLVSFDDPTHDISKLLKQMPHNYNPLETQVNNSMTLEVAPYSESYMLIPFTYHHSLFLLHRYPLMIEYTYKDATYYALYDDFLFIKTDPFLHPNDTLHNEVIYNDHY